MKLSNKIFDRLKWVAQIGLPAAGTLYFALAGIWHLPNAEQVVGTITAVDAFLGLLLGVSASSYNKTTGAPDGDLIVSVDPVTGEKYLGLGVNKSVDTLVTKDQVKLTVVNQPGSASS